jgi:hypothetical protein
MEDMGIFRRLISVGEGTQSFPFIIRITTVTSNTTFTLPLVDFAEFTPNISVNWGDGNSDTITSSTALNRSHIYSSAGTYDISISGFMPGFKVNNNTSIRSLIVALIQWGTVGLRTIDFYGCNNLTSIPGSGTLTNVGGYTGLSEVINFTATFRSTGLTSIPSDIFDYSPNALSFSNTFASTPITSVPTGLFDSVNNATDFSSCFSACTSLSTVPLTLFDQNINAVNFSSTFRNCLTLATCLQFTYNTQVTIFSNVYNMSTTSNLLTGTAPELWNRTPTPAGTDAFRNCTGLSNFASIPTIWK